MDKEPIEPKVIEMIQEIMDKDEVEISEDSSFFEDLLFDSISIMQLLVMAEEYYGFDTFDSERALDGFETVGAFVSFVKDYVYQGKDEKVQ